jgi:hypothetical protein
VSKDPSMSGIEHMRRAVRIFDSCNENFNQRFSPAQLLKLYDAYSACGWDITPDEWSVEQVSAALKGIVPRWESEGVPLLPEVPTGEPLGRTTSEVLHAIADLTVCDETDPKSVTRAFTRLPYAALIVSRFTQLSPVERQHVLTVVREQIMEGESEGPMFTVWAAIAGLLQTVEP